MSKILLQARLPSKEGFISMAYTECSWKRAVLNVQMKKLGIIVVSIAILGLFSAPNLSDAAELSPASSMGAFCKDLPRADYKKLKKIDVKQADADGWFEVYQVFNGVYAIYEPHQWQEVISYLIEGEQGALLFDTGNGIADIALVARSLTDRPISVLNSHSHYDHVGGNYAFDTVYGLDTAFTKSRELGQIHANIGIEVSPQALCKPLPKGVNPKEHIGRPFKITNIVSDGSVIDLGGRELEVIHLPGHTPDAIALIDRAAGLMWTGDSYYAGPIWLFAPETDLTAYEASLKRLLNEVDGLKAVLPAHNTPIQKPENLQRLVKAYHAMLNGDASKKSAGKGMVEYSIKGEDNFTFLMRDQPLPYAKQKVRVIGH